MLVTTAKPTMALTTGQGGPDPQGCEQLNLTFRDILLSFLKRLLSNSCDMWSKTKIFFKSNFLVAFKSPLLNLAQE